MRNFREGSFQPAPGLPPSCLQSATILFMCATLLALRICLLTLLAGTQMNALMPAVRSASSSLSWKSQLCAASPLLMSLSSLASHPTGMPTPHSHLSQGSRPSKKATKIIDVKRYLTDVVIATEGLLVVKDHPPFQTPRERIVVPRSVLDSLLTSLHIRFSHPSKHQTKRLFSTCFFALDIDKAIDSVSSACHTCQSLKGIPSHLQPQWTTDPPPATGVSFTADLCRRYCHSSLF